jgi:regulator of sigma E protease
MLEFLVAVIILGVLIFVHELGHFLLAKWNGVGVLEFSIGFGRKIWKKQVGETSYSIGLIPLGGYVRMLGDDPREVHSAASQNHPERSRWFLSKGYLPKASIVLAGPMFNLIFAVFASVASYSLYGQLKSVDLPVIGDVIPGYPAEKAGIQAKDKVISVDGVEVSTWRELADIVAQSAGREMQLEIDRTASGGEIERRSIKLSGTDDTADLAVVEGTLGKKSVKVGIVPDAERVPVAFSDAVLLGATHVYVLSRVTITGLWGMVQGLISPKHISGPIFIFKEAAKSANRGFEHVLEFMIFLSVSLAILNLLPIPILDGGHLVFFTLEALRGAPLSLRVQEWANQVGMLILLALMIFAFGNDLLKL